MAPTADTWVPQAAAEPPIPLPFAARPPRLRAAPGRPPGGRRGGAGDRTDCLLRGSKGYGICERRKRKSRRAGRRGIAYAAYGAFDGGVMRWV